MASPPGADTLCAMSFFERLLGAEPAPPDELDHAILGTLRRDGRSWTKLVELDEGFHARVVLADPIGPQEVAAYRWLREHWDELRERVEEDLRAVRADLEPDDDLLDVVEPPSFVLSAPGHGGLTCCFAWDSGGQSFTWDLEDGELAGPMIE